MVTGSGRKILAAAEIDDKLDQMASSIYEGTADIEDLVLVGIRTGGVFLANRLHDKIQGSFGRDVPVGILDIDKQHYWQNSEQYVGSFDLFSGVLKSVFFGAAIALISCYRGFHCAPGAEGVGRAATASFVYSFVIILILDLFLGITLDSIYYTIWPEGAKLF